MDSIHGGINHWKRNQTDKITVKGRTCFMKRIFSIIPIMVIILILSSCGKEVISIEDYEWKMRTVMSNDKDKAQNEDELIIAVGESDELYPAAKIIDLTLTAKDGKLVVTDITNGKTYDGTYQVIKQTPKSIDYEVVIDGLSGYATVASTEYYDGSEIPTLPINLGEYSIYFEPNVTTEK